MTNGTNDEDRPKNFKWYSPTNELISSDSSNRVFTLLTGSSLRLFFNYLEQEDIGTYTCTGEFNGQTLRVQADLILQSKFEKNSFNFSYFIHNLF